MENRGRREKEQERDVNGPTALLDARNTDTVDATLWALYMCQVACATCTESTASKIEQLANEVANVHGEKMKEKGKEEGVRLWQEIAEAIGELSCKLYTGRMQSNAHYVIRGPYTLCTVTCENMVGYGFSKFNPNDRGSLYMDYDKEVGKSIALGRACDDIAQKIVYKELGIKVSRHG